MERILITGANRGIGLAMVKHVLENGNGQVLATARKPQTANELQQLADRYPEQLMILQLDVTDSESVMALAQQSAKHISGLDVLINNAGVKPPYEAETFDTITAETLLNTLSINVAGPLMVIKALVDLLVTSDNPRIVNISSQMGSITWSGGDYYAYCTSKAALNMVTKRLANDLRSQGITVIAMHPGWVRTDMGGPSASLSPAESASGIINVISNLTLHQNGQFLKWDGEPHAW